MRNKLSESFIYTMVSIIGSFLPLILSLFNLRFESPTEDWPKLSTICGHGEIAIICIPLGIAIVYSLYTTKQSMSFFRWSDIVFWITCGFSATAISYYGLTINPNNSSPNKGLLYFSTIFSIWCFVGLFSSKYIERNRNDSVTQARSISQNGLEQRFNTMFGNSNSSRND